MSSLLALSAVVLVLTGCGTLSHALRPDATLAVTLTSALDATPPATPDAAGALAPLTVETLSIPTPVEPRAVNAALPDDRAPADAADPIACDLSASDTESVAAASMEPTSGDSVSLFAAAQTPRGEGTDQYDVEDYDPWEAFNETMFEFNRRLDRYVLKPVATVYDKILPDELQRMIANAVDNLRTFPRLVNSVLQGKWSGAGRELGRFVINSTFGIGGLWDIAKQEFRIEKSREDFGQTLGVWGVGAGPYLIVPFLEPFTVRDLIGYIVDGFLEPLTYLIPVFPERFAMHALEKVNERSLNLELFQGFEETVIDLYSAVRHAYLERRRNLIKE